MLFNLYTCHEALRRLDDYLDRELSPLEMQRVDQHLRICRYCSRHFAFEARFMEEMKSKLTRLSVPSSLQSKIALLLEREEADGGGPAPDPPDEP
jgi:anti-sigma factor (TIGR02949 family)